MKGSHFWETKKSREREKKKKKKKRRKEGRKKEKRRSKVWNAMVLYGSLVFLYGI